MPKNFVWRGEEIIVEGNSSVDILVADLYKVFQSGFRQTDSDKEALSKFQPLPETYISASSTKCSDGEFIGRDNELVSAGTYGFIYLIEANNLTTLNLPKEKGSYAIVSEVDSNLILGAKPSAFVAFALGIDENSFIINPKYNKIFDCEKIKKAIGEFSLIVPERLDINSDLPLSEIYQHYLQAEESNSQQAASSLGAASLQNRDSVIFFRGNIDKFPSQETSKSPQP